MNMSGAISLYGYFLNQNIIGILIIILLHLISGTRERTYAPFFASSDYNVFDSSLVYRLPNTFKAPIFLSQRKLARHLPQTKKNAACYSGPCYRIYRSIYNANNISIFNYWVFSSNTFTKHAINRIIFSIRQSTVLAGNRFPFALPCSGYYTSHGMKPSLRTCISSWNPSLVNKFCNCFDFQFLI